MHSVINEIQIVEMLMNIEVWILIQHIASKNFQIQLITYESHK